MELFCWSSEYEIDFPVIDEQHKGLVTIINDLYDAKVAGEADVAVVSTVERLLEYVDVHFRDEEQAMQDWAYPGLGKHREEHAQLTAKVGDYRLLLDKGEGVATFDLLNFLSEWFKIHICDSDRRFGLYVAEQQQGDAL